MDKILDFLNRQVATLFDLKIWQLICIGAAALLLLIIVISIISKGKKKKAKKPAVVVTEKKERVEEKVNFENLFIDRSQELEEDIKQEDTKEDIKKEELKEEISTEQEPIKEEKQQVEEDEIEEEKEEIVESMVKGKYLITKQKSGLFTFSLLANNGTVLFESEEYSTQNSCKNAVNTFKKYIKEDAFKISKTEHGDYTYVIKRPNGVYQGKTYASEHAARAATISIQKFFTTDNIMVIVEKR